MKIKTSELIGPTLDWAVAKCEGKGIEFDDPRDPWLVVDGIADQPLHSYSPSTDWAQGGLRIEREEICLAKVGRTLDDAMAPHPECWCAHIDGGFTRYASAPLIAAMRCLVTSKLGNEIEIPEELCSPSS